MTCTETQEIVLKYGQEDSFMSRQKVFMIFYLKVILWQHRLGMWPCFMRHLKLMWWATPKKIKCYRYWTASLGFCLLSDIGCHWLGWGKPFETTFSDQNSLKGTQTEGKPKFTFALKHPSKKGSLLACPLQSRFIPVQLENNTHPHLSRGLGQVWPWSEFLCSLFDCQGI